MPLRGSDGGYQHLGEHFALQVVQGEGGAQGVAGGGSCWRPESVLGSVQ